MINFEQPSAAKEEEKKSEKTALETKEGEKFFAEKLASPEDPRVEKVQEMLEKNFDKREVDSLETTKEAMNDESPYLIHVAENSKGEIIGLSMGAAVELVNKDGEPSEGEAVLLGCYAFTDPKERGKGIGRQLQSMLEKDGESNAKERGLKVAGFMTEAHGGAEKFINSVGGKRCYVEKDGVYKEIPYKQGPLEWDSKTGKPAEGAGVFPEHLMLKMSADKNLVSSTKFMEMVRGMFYYNNYPEDGHFKSKKAENAHAKFMEGMEDGLIDFIGRKAVRLFSAKERQVMKDRGVKFVEHRQKEDKAEATAAKGAEKREQKKEWKEHFGGLAEIQIAREKAERDLKKEKAEVESAKIPEKGMKTEEILKEAGIEKPAGSFEEFQKRLDEKMKGERTYKGESPSEGDKLLMARKEYLKELGYFVKYKGALLDKVEIQDENKKPLKEFRSFYFIRTERQVNDFLQEKLKEKFGEKPAEKLTKEDKLEKGYKNAVKMVDMEKVIREGKIAAAGELKQFGKEKWSKFKEGLLRLHLGEKLGTLFGAGKKLAIEGGKDLLSLGLAPAAALEEMGREVAGRFQTTWGTIEGRRAEAGGELAKKLESVKKHPDAPWSEAYRKRLEELKALSYKGYWDRRSGYEKLHKKGKILSLLETRKRIYG